MLQACLEFPSPHISERRHTPRISLRTWCHRTAGRPAGQGPLYTRRWCPRTLLWRQPFRKTRTINWSHFVFRPPDDFHDLFFFVQYLAHGFQHSYGAFIMTIPRIIHRVVPRTQTPLMQSCWDSVKRYTPDFQHLTHFDDGAYEIVSPYLSLCEQGAFKADLIRLEVLYRYGGIYVDSDVELFRSLDPLLDLDAFAVLENDSYPVNTVMGASVNNSAIHEILQLSCRLVHQGRLKYPYLFYNSAGEAFAFGPFAVSEALITHPHLTLLPSSDFLTYYKNIDFLSTNVDSNAYGQHHYAASWQPGGELFKTSWKIYFRMKLIDVKRRIGLLLTSLRFR